MKILVLDDDPDILKLIENTLKKEYTVTIKNSALDLDFNHLAYYDLIILDIMMPNMTGYEFLKKYRDMIDAPIILLTAKDFEKDKIEGFALGADDYVTKPFSIKELRSRISAHLRREKREKHHKLIDYPITCDLLKRQFFFENDEISLTASEYDICELLLKNKGQSFSKESIYTSIYGYDATGDSNTSITERIKLIRNKFSIYKINPIKTLWGVGYRWEIEEV